MKNRLLTLMASYLSTCIVALVSVSGQVYTLPTILGFRIAIMKTALWTCLSLIIIAMLWEVVGNRPSMTFVLPPFSAVIHSLWVNKALFFVHVQATVLVMTGGIIGAFLAALPIACAMQACRPLNKMLSPLLIASQCIPVFAIAPLMLLWFGWGYLAVLVPTVLMLFFPICIALHQGLSATPQVHLDFFSLSGATAWQTFWKLRFPWSLPHVCAGLRTSIGWAAMSAIVAEWVGAQKGLGFVILESRRSLDLATTFGSILLLIMVSLLFFALAYALEHSLLYRRKRSIFSGQSRVLSCLLLMCLLSGCTTTDEKRPVRLLLDWAPNPNHVALFAGLEEGMFADEGIDLQIISLQDPSDTFPILSTGQAELAISYMPSVILAESKEPGFSQVVGYLCKQPLNALCIRQRHPLKNASDVNHKVLGLSTDGLQTRLLHQVLAMNQASPRRICQLSLDPVAMLASGHVDALFGVFWNIEGEHLAYLGLPCQYLTVQELGIPNYCELVVIAKKNASFADPEFTSRFQKALQRSINFSQLNPERAFAHYAQINSHKALATLEWEENAWKQTYPLLPSNQDDESATWTQFAAWMNEHGLLDIH